MQSRTIGIGMILLGLLLSAIVCIGKAEEKQEDPRIETIQVVSIIGNELTYISSSASEAESSYQSPEDNERQERNRAEQNINDEQWDRKQIERNEEGKATNMSESADRSGEKRTGKGKGGSRNSKMIYLPVAVPVHTGEERVRTFTILQADDVLEVKIMKNAAGEECIVEIWMEGTRMEDE